MTNIKEIIKLADNKVTGIAAAPGIVISKAYVFTKEKLDISAELVSDISDAKNNFLEALAKSKKELNKILAIAREKMEEKRALIFEAQIMILDDTILIDTILKRIENESKNPEFIVNDEITKYQQIMLNSGESYMKERAHDIEDIKNRIIRNLQKKRWQSKITSDVIVVTESLTPADTILLHRSNVNGYVTNYGGLTSHAAIIARSLNIPAVVGTEDAVSKIKDGDTIIVDGFHGVVLINPNEVQLKFFNKKIETLNEINLQLAELRDKPAVTLDGKVINIMGNIDVTGEIDLLVTNGAKGIGLFRTEQILDELGEFPDEEEQFKIYTDLSERIYPDVLTIRAFDIGGDKITPLETHETNPFLGCRGVRFLLDNPVLFKTQTRAVLRASYHKNIHYMIPMISSIKEVRKAKELILECMNELANEKLPFDRDTKIGIMMEVPSAAVMADELSHEVDFFSIGTNDLIQFLIAVDRGNSFVSELYQEFHPAVVRTIHYIIRGGKKNNISVNLCGEMGADPLAIPLLVGLGLDSISVSASAIPNIKKIIRSFKIIDAQQLASECLRLRTEEEITNRIKQFFVDHSIERTKYILDK